MVPGGTTSTAAEVMAAAGAAYGGAISPLRENIGSFNYGGIDIGGQGFNNREAEDGRCAGVAKDTTAFTAGLRESLVGGVSWDLRGATLSGDQNKTFTHRVELPRDASSREAEKTPDYAGRRRSSGEARSAGGYGNIVTPESADESKSDLGQSSRLMHGESRSRGREVGLEMEGDFEMGRVSEAGATRGIHAY